MVNPASCASPCIVTMQLRIVVGIFVTCSHILEHLEPQQQLQIDEFHVGNPTKDKSVADAVLTVSKLPWKAPPFANGQSAKLQALLLENRTLGIVWVGVGVVTHV